MRSNAGIHKQRGIESGKRMVGNYLTPLEEAFFVIASEKFACLQRQRTANLVKCSLFDTGFKQLAVNFSANRGKEFFYFRNKGEGDFVLVEVSRPGSAIEVCWEIHEQTRKREILDLRKALAELGVQEGRVLSFDGRWLVEEFPQIPVYNSPIGNPLAMPGRLTKIDL